MHFGGNVAVLRNIFRAMGRKLLHLRGNFTFLGRELLHF